PDNLYIKNIPEIEGAESPTTDIDTTDDSRPGYTDVTIQSIETELSIKPSLAHTVLQGLSSTNILYKKIEDKSKNKNKREDSKFF
ncbi:22341_t:CDS:2, partial [Gigaspora margarita]